MIINLFEYIYCSITHSPSSTRKLATTGIGHHITTSTTSTGSTRSPVMPHYGGGAEKCVRCLKSVYLAEKKIGAGKVSFITKQTHIDRHRWFSFSSHIALSQQLFQL